MGDHIYEKDFNSAAQYFRDHYVSVARKNYADVDEQFDRFDLAQQDANASVTDVKTARDIAYARALNTLRLDSNSEFYANTPTSVLETKSAWINVVNGAINGDGDLSQIDASGLGGPGMVVVATAWKEANKETRANLAKELNAANDLLANSSNETARAANQLRVDEINAKIESYDQNLSVANEMTDEGRLYATLGDQRKWVAEGLTQGFSEDAHVWNAMCGSHDDYMGTFRQNGLDSPTVPTGNWDTVNRDAERLAILEYQYFNDYEKNRLTGTELEARQAEIDKMVEAYPDCTKYRYMFLSNEVNLDAGLNNKQIIKVAASYETEKKTEPTAEAKSQMKAPKSAREVSVMATQPSNKDVIEQFEKDFPNGERDQWTSENEFNQRYRRYLSCKDAEGMALSNDEMQWVVADFEKNPPSINSASDYKQYEAMKARTGRYKTKLAESSVSVETDGVSKNIAEDSTSVKQNMGANVQLQSNQPQGNPYEYTKPIREANMSNADYDALCKQAEQDHIAKINNEMADKVIRGEYGCGQERFDKLSAEGYNYTQVQDIVNQKMAAYEAQRSSSMSQQAAVQSDVNAAKDVSSKTDQNAPQDTKIVDTLERVDAKDKQSVSTKKLYVNTPAPDLTVPEGANENVLTRVNNETYIDQITSKVDNTKLNEMVDAKFATNETQRKLAEEFATNDTQKKLAEKFDTNKTQDYLAEEINNSATTDYLKTPIDNSKVDLYVHEDSKKSLKNRFDTIVTNSEAANNAAKQAQHDAEAELGS